MKNRFKIPLLAFILLGVVGFTGVSGVVKEGNELFDGEKYDEALSKYTDAQIDNPDNPSLDYNIGAVLYKQKKFDQAVESFRKVINATDDPVLREDAYYNMGNAYFRQAESAGDMELLSKAIDSYTETLKIDPEDEDAKYNLEVARKMLEMKKEEQPESSSCDRKKPGEQNQDDQSEKESKPATGESQIAPAEDKQATQEKEMQSEPERKEGEMTREEAERLLNALEDRERQNAREEQEVQSRGARPFAGKDW